MNRLFAIFACLLAVAAPARAELRIEEQDVEGGQLTIFKMTVTPAAEPVPALKHRLVLREIDEKVGNAASMYYRAIMASESAAKALKDRFGDELDDAVDGWSDPDWPVAKLRETVDIINLNLVMTHLREASVRRDCNWGFDLQSVRGPDLYGFLLPEIQECRQLSRFLALRAKLAIIEGRFDDAVEDLRINLKMARDVASEPLLVNGLVGLAQAGIGNRVVVELIASPSSPNMYWALTEPQDPLIDMRHAIRFEMSSVQRIFPFLRDAETQEHSPDEWTRLLARGLADLGPLTGGGGEVMDSDAIRRMAVAGLALATYPPAKQRLLAMGFEPQRVERMPVGQVIAIDAAREFRRIADEFEKWWYLPYGAAQGRDDRVEEELGSRKLEGGYGRVLAALLMPALNAARSAQERHGWQSDALRVVEALRMHAAETGKLPETLDDIEVVPVPNNRVTGKPYQYRLNGDTAVLELPFSDGFPNVAWRFEIQLAD
jgi:hypothetical protein